ncbi:hypothetical protein BJ166DRAFT_610555 [Pestalotiopsis sp. NC0098]|nr:hypothetical protein BJ166DRAFT_610555 [Pestalotiopsis sp. NC0098]
MASTGSRFPWELWLEICEQIEREYADTAAEQALGIVTAISGLSRSCRALHNTLLSSLYGSPVLVSARSLELYFRTIVENDDLASKARMVRWYEGDQREVNQLIDEESSFSINGVEDGPFEFGDNFNARYSAKVDALGILLNGLWNTTRCNHIIMHNYHQILPFFLPNLKALDYQHNPRIYGYDVLWSSEYRSRDALRLTDISIRAAREDSLKLTALLPLFSRSRETLENLHLEWPLAMGDLMRNFRTFGDWPTRPLFTNLKKLSVRNGCLGRGSFHELLFHVPRLEELVYHSARVSHDTGEEPDYYNVETLGDETPGDENDGFLTWLGVVRSLDQVQDTLQRLELDLHERYFKDCYDSMIGLRNWKSLRTVVLGHDAILHGDLEPRDWEPSHWMPRARQRLTEILPKRLKHLELRNIRCDYQEIEAFAEAVQERKFRELETVEMNITWLKYSDKDCQDNLEEIKAMLESRGVRTKISTFEEE